jgi:hypothetical protein
VLSAQVNLATKDVHVRYRPEEVAHGEMERAIARVDLRLRTRHWLHRWIARLIGGDVRGPRDGGAGSGPARPGA